MRAIVPLISAFAVFVHAAVGCCAHHAHAQVGPARCHGHSEIGHGDHAPNCGGHHAAVEQTDDSKKSEPSDGNCDGTRCLGIRAAKALPSDAAGGMPGELGVAARVERMAPDLVGTAGSMGHSFAPSVRRHLALCVLLI